LEKECELLGAPYRELLFKENAIRHKATGMANAWFTGNLKGNPYVAHAGGGGGYYTELRLYPGLGVGSTIMLNRSGFSDERLLDMTDGFFISSRV
jgi:hypothetical protein